MALDHQKCCYLLSGPNGSNFRYNLNEIPVSTANETAAEKDLRRNSCSQDFNLTIENFPKNNEDKSFACFVK